MRIVLFFYPYVFLVRTITQASPCARGGAPSASVVAHVMGNVTVRGNNHAFATVGGRPQPHSELTFEEGKRVKYASF